jgi:anhydro-N-acetylmuramic acid kinase
MPVFWLIIFGFPTYQSISLYDYGELDTQLGLLYAQCCLTLLRQVNIKAEHVKAIGNHGQTLYHSPNSKYPFTIQVGNPNIISQKTFARDYLSL